MIQTISISLSTSELTELISSAVGKAIDNKLKPSQQEELFTIKQATEYLKCSEVFLWKKRRANQIFAVNAGKKVLYPKSSLDAYINLNVKKS